MKNRYNILLLILILIRGFDIIFLNIRILDYLCCLILFGYTFIGFKRKSENHLLILLFNLFVLISCIYSDITKGQSFIRTVVNSCQYWGLLFYFALSYYRPSIAQCKKILFTLAYIFCICYIIQWIIYPTVLFSGVEAEDKVNVEIFRMRMSGSILCYILYFEGINRFLINKKKQYLLYSIVGFIPILIMGFRSLIFCTLLGTLIMIPVITKKISKTIIYITLGFIISGLSYLFIPIVNEKVNEMLLRQETDNFNNDDYIRIISYNYFMENFSNTDKFWGCGVPDTQSNFGKEIFDLQEKGLYLSDLGLIGLSIMIGLPAVIILSIIIFKCIINCKDINLQFIRFTLLTIFISSIFTSMEIYRSGNFIIIALILYFVSIYNKSLKELKNTST